MGRLNDVKENIYNQYRKYEDQLELLKDRI
jgi:hypothetical protein